MPVVHYWYSHSQELNGLTNDLYDGFKIETNRNLMEVVGSKVRDWRGKLGRFESGTGENSWGKQNAKNKIKGQNHI